MINNKKVLGVIPARAGSKGLPGKNIALIAGKPLIQWTIDVAKKSQYIDQLIVSTDSEEIANFSKSHGVEAPFIRPDYLANDTAKTIDVLLHVIDYLKQVGSEFDYVVLLEPTSPLRDLNDIDGAMKALLSSSADSIVGVSRVEGAHPIFLNKIKDNILVPYTGQYPNSIRRQDIESDYYYLEGSIYISKIDALRQKNGFYHESTIPWVVPKEKSFELDDSVDFLIISALLNNREKTIEL